VEKQAGIEVVAGDRVISSGLDGIFPKGILVGVVHSVETTRSSLFYEIKVRQAVDFRRLENVFVIIPSQSESGIEDARLTLNAENPENEDIIND
jgi:cell shape-determining protein MreC